MTTRLTAAALALLLTVPAWAAEDKKAGDAKKDLPQGTFKATHAPAGTTVTLKLDKGKYTATMNDMVIVEGSYKITGDEVEFTDEKGQAAGTGYQKSGTYK